MAIFDGSGFWAFVFWSTVILTSLIIGLNLFEILPKLQMSFSYTDKVVSSQCLKIAQKVTFNIASEASYVYILSGQKLIKNAKNGPFWRVFENMKLADKFKNVNATLLNTVQRQIAFE